MERYGFPPRRAGPEAWKFRHGAKSGRARCVRFRTQRRNPTVGTLGRGPSFELPSPPTPACSPVESLRILFSPSFPRPTPPPDGWEPSRETSGFRGAGGAPPWRRPRSPGGASALRTAATSPPAAPAAHRGSPAQTHVGPKQPGRSRPEEAGRVRVSKSSGGTEAVSFWPELDFSAVTQRAASLRSRKTRWEGAWGGRVTLTPRRVRGGVSSGA